MPGSPIYGIAAGPDGALWYTDCGTDSIGRITTNGTVSGYPLHTRDVLPYHIVAGPDDALWFTNSGKQAIGRLTPP